MNKISTINQQTLRRRNKKFNDPNPFIEYSNTMNDIDDYNQKRKQKMK